MNKLEAHTEEGKHMADTSRPFAEKKFTEVKGHRGLRHALHSHRLDDPPVR